MPKSPEHEGSPRLMTTTEIAAEHGVSRQTIHTYRRTGVFPSPVEGEGSTRPRFREDEVAAFFKANPKQPRKKRRYPPDQQGDPMDAPQTLDDVISTTLNSLQGGTHHLAPLTLAVLTEKLTEALTPFVALQRAAVVAEVVAALQSKAQELSAEAEEEMRRDLEEEAQVWHDAAAVAAKLKRAKTEE